MVVPGFTQAVASDFPRDINGNNCVMNNTPCLYTGNCFAVLEIACKDIITALMRIMLLKCGNYLFIQGNRFHFTGFFCQRNMFAKIMSFFFIYVGPFQS